MNKQMHHKPKAILLIGIQASGKSSFYQRMFSEYVHINLDMLHTRNKEHQFLQECFQHGWSFVVDNTNPTREERTKYIQPARQYGYEIEGYFVQSIVSECIRRNQNRTGKARVPDKAIVCTSNRLELPSLEEGFDKLFFVRIENNDFVIDSWKEEQAEEGEK